IPFSKMRPTSNSYRMDGPFRWYCSSHPSFSRWGQSVRTETMLERCAQRTSEWIRLRRSFDVENLPTGAADEWTTRPSIDSTLGSPPGTAPGEGGDGSASTSVGG